MTRAAYVCAAVVGALLLATPGRAQYQFYFQDSLTSINTSNWTQDGSVAANSSGLTATDPNGGSLISKIAIPDGSSDVDVRATIHLTQSGGNYTVFAKATSDSRTGGGGSGTFLAFEMQNPTFDGSGNCSANFVTYQRINGTTTVLQSLVHACHDGMVIRMAVHNALEVWPDETGPSIYFGDGPYVLSIPSGATSGQPGIGAYGMPSGNSISLVQLGPADRVAPYAINAQSIGISATPSEIDFQWQGATDNPGGVGFLSYWIYRDGAFLGGTKVPIFADPTVSAGSTHTYTVVTYDEHLNAATPVSFTTSAPPATSVEPRRTGVRPLISYWGAAASRSICNRET